ncbi:MAG: hypothetical protein WBA89_15385 [Microcoleus sp.]|uniref:hypothetical protein n=1 Tax=Microcoleus sp. TaxID=44472 RepID=UPI003C76EA26
MQGCISDLAAFFRVLSRVRPGFITKRATAIALHNFAQLMLHKALFNLAHYCHFLTKILAIFSVNFNDVFVTFCHKNICINWGASQFCIKIAVAFWRSSAQNRVCDRSPAGMPIKTGSILPDRR